MEKLYEGYQERQEEIVMDYTVFMGSTYYENNHSFIYSFGIQRVSRENEFLPDLYLKDNVLEVMVGRADQKEYNVLIQTTSFGGLTSEEHAKFIMAINQAHFAAKEIQKKINTFIEYHETVLLSE